MTKNIFFNPNFEMLATSSVQDETGHNQLKCPLLKVFVQDFKMKTIKKKCVGSYELKTDFDSARQQNLPYIKKPKMALKIDFFQN